MENDFLYKIKELEAAAKKLLLEYSIIEGENAQKFILDTINKFKPIKVIGNLSIGSDISEKLPTDEYEFNFSEKYISGTVSIFFEQDYYNKNQIFVLKNGKLFSKLMQECYGMEYFLTNDINSYLISVNWYVIEILFKNE
ncbi:hypothetical protein [Chryseobacterium sp. BLS98]|uniref:hypothetical protein n=1 Tax=Chryseobacterium sp. BLS98 TaxID=885586 RepID=UPI00065AB073|nr:hypothetical protein [Chryseobacterium sp. BLS98]